MKSNIKISVWSFLIFSLLMIGIISPAWGSINYQTTIAKGTDEFVIDQYNESSWDAVVDSSINPSDWFEGEANITNARSKITVKGWTTASWQLYDVLITLFMPAQFTTEEMITIISIMGMQEFNETTINANYTSEYNLWYGLRAVWNFTTGSYEEDPSYSDGVFVLWNPSDYVTMLNDYNSLIEVLNGNTAIIMSGYSFQNFTGDEFLWQLTMNGLAIASPQTDYLNDLVNDLGCTNATVSGSTLIFNRYGITDYTVEISYGSKGILSEFSVKDTVDIVIFKLTSSNTEWIFFTILLSSSVFVILVIAYMIYKNIRLKKR
jgi:hypothetical protein